MPKFIHFVKTQNYTGALRKCSIGGYLLSILLLLVLLSQRYDFRMNGGMARILMSKRRRPLENGWDLHRQKEIEGSIV